jgi:hypothetical protein
VRGDERPITHVGEEGRDAPHPFLNALQPRTFMISEAAVRTAARGLEGDEKDAGQTRTETHIAGETR